MRAQRVSRPIVVLFNFGARWGWAVNAMPQLIYPREWPSTPCIGGWLGPMAGVDGCRKSRPPPGFNPQTVQPITRHYTDYAIPETCHVFGVYNVAASLWLQFMVLVMLFPMMNVLYFCISTFQCMCAVVAFMFLTVASH
jgi:hypothetical protein